MSKPRYSIDSHWYEENNRSLQTFIQSRLCPSCRSKLGTEAERSIPVETSNGKVIFETRRVAYGDDPLALIRDCCSKAQDFITPYLPIMEIVFRAFLANGNQPLALDEVEKVLETKLAAADRPRIVPLETLQLMLDSDSYYGLRRYPTAEDE